MSIFLTTVWDEYKVTVSPHEFTRKRVHYHNGYLPYMDGQQIGLDLTIKPPKYLKEDEDIVCEWLVRKYDDKGQKEIFGEGKFTLHMLPNKKYKTMLSSKFITEPSKYIFDFKLTRPNQTKQEYEFQMNALLSVKDRAEVYLQLVLPFGISIFTLFLSVVLSIISSIIVARLLGE